MSDSLSHIAVLGAGAWGTALALAAHGAGRQVTLWVREEDVLADIRAGRGVLRRVERGEIDPSFVITHTASLEEGPELYKTFRDKKDGCIKVVLKP